MLVLLEKVIADNCSVEFHWTETNKRHYCLLESNWSVGEITSERWDGQIRQTKEEKGSIASEGELESQLLRPSLARPCEEILFLNFMDLKYLSRNGERRRSLTKQILKKVQGFFFPSGDKSVQYQKSNMRHSQGSGAMGNEESFTKMSFWRFSVKFLCLTENRVTKIYIINK